MMQCVWWLLVLRRVALGEFGRTDHLMGRYWRFQRWVGTHLYGLKQVFEHQDNFGLDW